MSTNYVLFITDGDNSDKQRTDKVISELSQYPIFFQFIGIGHSSFNYLEKLDEMDGRYVDNANFFSVNNIQSIDDKELYDKLLAEYPSWLENEKVKEMIKSAGTSQTIKSMHEQKKEEHKKGFFNKLFG